MICITMLVFLMKIDDISDDFNENDNGDDDEDCNDNAVCLLTRASFCLKAALSQLESLQPFYIFPTEVQKVASALVLFLPVHCLCKVLGFLCAKNLFACLLS